MYVSDLRQKLYRGLEQVSQEDSASESDVLNWLEDVLTQPTALCNIEVSGTDLNDKPIHGYWRKGDVLFPEEVEVILDMIQIYKTKKGTEATKEKLDTLPVLLAALTQNKEYAQQLEKILAA